MTGRIIWTLLLVGTLLVGSLAWLGTPATAAAAPQATEATRPAERERSRQGNPLLVWVLVGVTADQSNLPVGEVLDALNQGQSLALVAADHGSSGDAVVQEVADRAAALLDEAVANGRITRQQADRLLTRLTERASELVDDTSLGPKIEQQREQQARRLLVHATADETGLSFREIIQRVRQGESVAEIAESAGSSGAAVVDQAESLLTERLGHIVAGGHISQEEADSYVAEFRTLAEQMVDETR